LKPLEKLSGYHEYLMTLLLSFQLFLTLAAVFFDLNNFTLNLIVFVLSFLFFFLTKDSSKDKSKVIVILKFSCSLFIFSLLNMPLHLLRNYVDKVPVALPFMINTTAFFVSFFLFRSNSVKELFNIIADTNVGILKGSSKKNKGDIVICKNLKTHKPVVIPKKDRYLHLLILGPTGSGKTSQIILPMLNQDMKNPDMGITVIEPKSDLAEKVYALAKINGRDCVYFNPTHPDCPYFNPLYGDEVEVIENMATTFNMLNADSQQYFKDMNEQLVRNSLKVLKRLYGNKATLIHLSRLIQNSGGQGRQMVLDFTRVPTPSEEIAKENQDLASWFLNDYFMERSKTYENTSGIRSQITKITSNNYLRRILNPPNGENDVDFDKHLAEGGVIAITTAQGDLRDLGKFLGYFIILQFQSAVFRRGGNENTRRDHSLYIDEFQSYSNPGFSDMLTQGRSYRVACHLATQNRSLMGMGSGKDGRSFIDLVSTNARNIVLFPGGNAADAEFYSKQFGEVKRIKKERGVSKKIFNPLYGFENIGYPSETIRKSEKQEARFSPTDIMYRPFGEITYCIVQNNEVQYPDVGKIEFLPIEISRSVDEIVEDYNRSQMKAGNNSEKKEALASSETEDIEISFDDIIEPALEDYIDTPKVSPESPHNSESDDSIYYPDDGFDVIDDYNRREEVRDDDKKEEDDSGAKMDDDMRLFEEDEEDRDDDDDDSIIPIFGDEEDSLI
jgi:type IV secretory pathway TraG/TraD family ATPase VirD4